MNKKIVLDRKKGIFFWITGLSGSGKTVIAKKILKPVRNEYGPTLLMSGDTLRRIFKIKGYSLEERKAIDRLFVNFYKFVTDQKINLIFTAIGMTDFTRNLNKRRIKNYVEIYVKSDVKKIIRLGKKRIYHSRMKNIVGVDIKAEFPKKPHIILENNFKSTPNHLSKILFKKIKKLI